MAQVRAPRAFAARLSCLAGSLLILVAAHPGDHGATREPAAKAESQVVAGNSPIGTVEAFHAALSRGDTATVLGLLAEDVLIFESGGAELSRAEYAEHHLAADQEYSKAVTRKLERRTMGSDGQMAWVTSIETVGGHFRDRDINSRSVETMLLRKVDGRWRIIHIHWSSAKLTSG